MDQDDIKYVMELLEDAMSNQDWDLILEAQQYLSEFSISEKKSVKYTDEE